MKYPSAMKWTRVRINLTYLAAVMIAVSITGQNQHTHATTFTKIALAGEPAPGTTASFGPSAFEFFSTAVQLNDAGQVSFHATLDQTVLGLPPEGIWGGTPGNLQPVAINDDPVLGSPEGIAINLSSLDHPIPLSENGQVAFTAFLKGGPGTGFSSIWRSTPGNIENIAMTNTQAPGAQTGQTVDWFVRTTPNNINGSGDVAFRATITNPDGSTSTDQGIWIAHETDATPVVITGQQIPGRPVGFTFAGAILQGLNNNDQVIFNAVDPALSTNTQGLWIGTDYNNLRPIIGSAGASVPVIKPDGTPSKTYIPPQAFYGAQLNNAGQVAFAARDDNDKAGLWIDDNGAVTPVAIEGGPAPGAPSGSLLNAFDPDIADFSGVENPGYAFNDAGDVAFIASVDIPTTNGIQTLDGIWSGQPGNLQLIALQGQPTPVQGSQTVFGNLFNLLLNDLGQVVFASDNGLWLADPIQGLSLIAETGDTIDVASGDTRTIFGIVPSDFNNRGQLTANILLADNSTGIFLITVPEPTTATLLMCAALGLTINRRR